MYQLSAASVIMCFLDRLSFICRASFVFTSFTSASDWQSGAEPGKCQDVSRWPSSGSGFLHRNSPLSKCNQKGSTGVSLCFTCVLVFELLRGRRLRILLDDVHFHSVTMLFLWGKMWEIEFNQVFTNARRRH